MSKYYYLIAGLPNISLNDVKIPFSLSELRNELDDILTNTDKVFINLFFHKFDNKNLITQLSKLDSNTDKIGSLTFEKLQELIVAVKEDENLSNKKIPAYLIEFIRIYFDAQEIDEKTVISWEDRLAAMYYDYSIKCRNKFIAEWFELNLNINNIITAITCRKYGLERADYIVGSNEIAQSLRTSNARDFGIGDSVEYLPEIQRIAEETDLLAREKKTDLLKWLWLDENTFFKTFDIESVFAYLVRLEMMERWITLDKTAGEKTFRELIGAMKTGSNEALEEFKRNNK